MISQKQLFELRMKVGLALAGDRELDRLFDEFLVESGGSYDVDKFSEWFKKRLYSEEGLSMLARQESQKPDK